MQLLGIIKFRRLLILIKANLFLSSLSVVLNSTAGVLLEDICRGCFKGKPSDKAANLIVKSSIVILGALSMVFLLLVEKLGGILEVIEQLIHYNAICSRISCE